MPLNYIQITKNDSAAYLAQELLGAVNAVRNAAEKLAKVESIATQMVDVPGANYTEFETRFGVPTGKGATVFDFIKNAQKALKGTLQSDDAIKLIERVG